MRAGDALEPRPYLLHNRIQPYTWGGRGPDAFIPRLLGIVAEPGRPYAELWIGAHPSAPSSVELDGACVPLPELIAAQPWAILGPAVAREFGGLPFLLKVLSAAEPLSIQVHPNRAQAERLHARDPEHYPDGNHKPEVAIALDSLTALVGFKPFAGILQALAAVPELADLAGPELCRALANGRSAPYAAQQVLAQRLVHALLHDEAGMEAALVRLERRLRGSTRPLQEEEALFLELRRSYPGADAGLLAIFLLNPVHLRPGQAVYIGAGMPHAYIRGNIVECMAASDNVVRAGLTPKLKDMAALAEVLAYDLGPARLLDGTVSGDDVVYATPAAEFEVARWALAPGTARREAGGRPAILLVTAGEVRLAWPEGGAMALQRGQSALIPALLPEYGLAADRVAQVFRAAVP